MGSPDDPAQPPSPDGDVGILRERDRIALGLQNEVIQRVFATGPNLQGTAEITLDPLARRRVDHAINDLDHVVHIIRGTGPKAERAPRYSSPARGAFGVAYRGARMPRRAPGVSVGPRSMLT